MEVKSVGELCPTKLLLRAAEDSPASGVADVLPWIFTFPVLSRAMELTVALLPFLFAKFCPRRWPEDRDIESQARPAALEATGGSVLLPVDSLDLEDRFPSLFCGRRVVLRRFLFSGLGVLEGSFGGWESCGEL